MKIIQIVICLLACVQALPGGYRATFKKENISLGTVTLNGGLEIEFDMAAVVNALAGTSRYNESCYADGLKYHIHTKSDFGTDGFGDTECSSEKAGGHWDPGFAKQNVCGTTTCDCTDDESTEYSTRCSTNKVTGCEAGDLSGIHGVYNLNSNKSTYQFNNFVVPYMGGASSINFTTEELSIVFHCTNGDRLMCASLQFDDTVVGPQTLPVVPAKFPLTATFDFGTVIVTPGRTLELSLTTFNFTGTNSAGAAVACADSALSYHIHDKWTAAGNCGSSGTGGHYDPTLACGGASGNTQCNRTCVGSAYDCTPATFGENPFNCEVGDLSGRYGKASVGGLQYDLGFMPPSSALTGKSIVFHCGSTRVACAPLLSTSTGDSTGGNSTGGDSTGGNSTGGDSTGGNSTGGDSTGGDSTGDDSIGGASKAILSVGVLFAAWAL